MLEAIKIIILVLSGLDLIFAYLYLNKLQKIYKETSITKFEANPILKYSIKKFGLDKGVVFGGLFIFGILIFLILFMSKNQLFFLAGVYSMMLVYHGLNFNLLSFKKNKISQLNNKKEGINDECIC